MFYKPDSIFPRYILPEEIYLLCAAATVILLIFSLIIAIGLLKGLNWARMITIIFQAINIVTSAISFNILGIIISALIIYYLTRPHVKEYFLLDVFHFKTSVE